MKLPKARPGWQYGDGELLVRVLVRAIACPAGHRDLRLPVALEPFNRVCVF